MSPKIVDKVKRRKDLALAALDVFAENGFAQTSVQQIAEAVGVGKGTLYEYFDSKDDLILHSMSAWLESYIDESSMDRLSGLPSAREQLKELAIQMTEEFLRDDQTTRLMLAFFEWMVSSKDPAAHAKVVVELLEGVRQVVDGIIARGIGEGVFRPDTAEVSSLLALNLMAYLDGISLYALFLGDRIDVREHVGFQMDLILKALGPHDWVDENRHENRDKNK